jgi:hypothetical protein
VLAVLAAVFAALCVSAARGEGEGPWTYPLSISGSASFTYKYSGSETEQGGWTSTYSTSVSVEVDVTDGVWDRLGDPNLGQPVSYELQSGTLAVSGSSDETATGTPTVGCQTQTTDAFSPRSPAPGENQRFDFTDVAGGGQPNFDVVARDVDASSQVTSAIGNSSCSDAGTTSSTTDSTFEIGTNLSSFTVSNGPRFSATLTQQPTCTASPGSTVTACDLTATYAINGGCSGEGVCGYVALGDSYASGAGDRDYFAGTGKDGDRCERSRNAYPVLLADRLQITSFDGSPGAGNAFAACSGATVQAITSGFGDEPAQIEHLDKGTSLVTISIGASDLGLASVVNYCVTQLYCAGHESPIVRRKLDQLIARIPQLLQDIWSKAPAARIIVVGYPDFLPARGTCALGKGIARLFDLTAVNVAWLNATLNEIDLELSSTIGNVTPGGDVTGQVDFVNPDTAGYAQLWAEHKICGRKSWFNKISAADLVHGRLSSVIGPNDAGQRELEQEIYAELP